MTFIKKGKKIYNAMFWNTMPDGRNTSKCASEKYSFL